MLSSRQGCLTNSTDNREEKTATCTHIDILQIQEVQYDAVSLPDDRRAQRPLDSTGKHGTEAHGHSGDADLLVLRQAQLHNLCWNKSKKGDDWRCRDRTYSREANTRRE